MSVLVVAAHDGKTVRANVANAVAAATQIDPDVHVLVAGQGAKAAADAAAEQLRAKKREERKEKLHDRIEALKAKFA